MPDEVKSVPAVEFLQYHQPGLTDGDYEITVTQTVHSDDPNHPADATFTTQGEFTVAGERFDLKPADIHSVFPPDGNLGDHDNVLPHIILNRSTFPWERRAEQVIPGQEEETSDLPWLALLLFDDAEKPVPMLAHLAIPSGSLPTITLDSSTTPATDGKFPKLIAKDVAALPSDVPFLKLESGQHDGDKFTVIDVKQSWLAANMPAVAELPFLAHVRLGIDPDEDPTGKELAVIISNRLPQKGKTSTAHLVSIEGRLKNVSGTYEFDYQNAGDDDLIRLVSLKSWSFACEDPQKSFKGLLLNLNERGAPPSTLRLPAEANVTADTRAEKLLSRGYVLVPHYLRQGDKTASWYHGPLIPGKNAADEIKLPIASADELVRYDPAIGMFDVSYAAAWELGRLLALQSKAFSTSLYQWKRQHAQQLAQEEQYVSHLPFKEKPSGEPPPLSDAVASWFDRTSRLEGVPFDYLVPDERMLPAESIRFFRLDSKWVGCLLDGAFSIGRVTSSEYQRDQTRGPNSGAADDSPPITGFLLRSEVVSGWPGLLVDAYADQMKDPPGDRQSLTMVRMERLASNVLICLFEGEIKTVEIHQKPETLHFGFDNPPPAFSKQLRNPDSGGPLGEKGTLEIDEWRSSASQRTLNISGLVQAINDKIAQATSEPSPPLSKFTSAQFALQMIEGVQKVIFLAGPTVT